MIVVSDTTTLSNFLQIDRLDLLPALFGTVIIPPAVYQELVVLDQFGIDTQPIQQADWLQRQLPDPNALLVKLKIDLDQGEAEAIALALALQADYLLMDEQLGRAQAQSLNLPILGSLGVLLRAKQANLIALVKPEMDNLIQCGFWISDALYQKVLKLAKE